MQLIIICGLIIMFAAYLYDYYEPSFDTVMFDNENWVVMWYNTYINYQDEPKRDYIKLFKKHE